MKLIVANTDRSADLGAEIRRAVEARAGQAGPRRLSPGHSALHLRDAGTEAEYLRRYMALLRIRSGLDTSPFAIPTKPGFVGRVRAGVRRFLWKLLRYQHDRMGFQQAGFDHLIAGAVEFEKAAREVEIRRLDERIAELERRTGGTAGGVAP